MSSPDIKNPDGSLMNYDQIVNHLYTNLPNEDIKRLSEMTESEVRGLHHFWGMAIRNSFGLWRKDHPTTANWHNEPENHRIVDGTDCSDDHPDQVSNNIMVAVWKRAKELV
jgi:hypothetical protein